MPGLDFVAVYIFQQFCYGFGLAAGMSVPFYFLYRQAKKLG